MNSPPHQYLCSPHGNRLTAFAEQYRWRAITPAHFQTATSPVPTRIPAAHLSVLRAEIRFLVESIEPPPR